MVEVAEMQVRNVRHSDELGRTLADTEALITAPAQLPLDQRGEPWQPLLPVQATSLADERAAGLAIWGGDDRDRADAFASAQPLGDVEPEAATSEDYIAKQLRRHS